MRRDVCTLLICAAWMVPAGAVTVAPLTFDQLVNASAVIVDARVSDVRGQWGPARDRIDSIVTVEVIGALKGRPGATLSFTVPGGEAGRYATVVPGAPAFAPGDRAVVFLSERGARLPVPTGLTQGIYRVTRDPRSGSERVAPPRLEGPDPRPRGDLGRRPLSLPAFEAAVRAVRPPAP